MARRSKRRELEISMDEVSLRCMGCQSPSSLIDAVKSDWQMCDHCNFFICPWCRERIGEARFCLSYPCQRTRRPFKLGAIPVERILVFARNSYRRSYREGLLYRLFFEQAEQAGSPWSLIAPDEQQAPDAIVPRMQEEVWSNHQLVVTKRRGGKFITWEKIV